MSLPLMVYSNNDQPRTNYLLRQQSLNFNKLLIYKRVISTWNIHHANAETVLSVPSFEIIYLWIYYDYELWGSIFRLMIYHL